MLRSEAATAKREYAAGKYVLLLCFILLFIELIPHKAFSQQNNSQIVIPKLNEPVQLDGYVDEEFWQNARALPVIQHLPDFGSKPNKKTEFLIGYTEDYLYAACRCYDEGSLSVPSFKRDYFTPDTDAFMLLLDTFNDNENGLVFITTPSGLRTDVAVFNDASGSFPVDLDWNTYWDVETRQTSEGWFVEMRIPISSLRFDSEQGQVVMGLSMNRLIPKPRENIVFPAIPRKWGSWSLWKPSQAQDVLFKNLNPEPPVRLTPYFLGGFEQESTLNNTKTDYSRETDPTLDAGLDFKYGLSSNFTLDLTINTDFAQVEADNQQVNLTRFPLFFPEKRRFFLERASTFAFGFGGPNRLFYSRRIGLFNGQQVRILGGARVVGRSGPWDIGLLSMQTAREPELRPGNKTLPSENFSVVRVQREVINEDSNIGGIFTSRVGLDGGYNVAYGLDALIRIAGQQYVAAKWAQTFTDELSSRVASLAPARMHLQWERRSYEGFNYNFRFDRAGQRYKPGLGLELRENYFRVGDRISYGWIPGNESSVQQHRINFETTAYFRNSDGTIQSMEIGPNWEMTTNKGHSLNLGITRRTEDLREPFKLSTNTLIPPGRYNFYAGEISYGMPSGWSFRANTSMNGGSFYDGRRGSFEIAPTWNVSRYLRLNGFYQFNRITFEDRDQSFDSHVVRLRAEVTPNVEYSVSSFIQYNSAREVVVGNIRFRYNPRQGNDLYLVYNERLNSNRTVTAGPRLPLSSQRIILLKYTYTFNW